MHRNRSLIIFGLLLILVFISIGCGGYSDYECRVTNISGGTTWWETFRATDEDDAFLSCQEDWGYYSNYSCCCCQKK